MRTLTHGDKRAAAETLGISLNTLYRRPNAYEAAGPRDAVFELLTGTPRAAIVFARACC